MRKERKKVEFSGKALRGIESILNPKSVAVIGASDNVARIGGRPIHAMLQSGYAGRIVPVNPNHRRIQGLEAFPDILSVSDPIDTAIIAVPAASVIDTVRQCAAGGVRSAIIFSSGFAESGDAGSRAQAEIAAIAADSGIRILGPNCLGAFHVPSGWYGTFANAAIMEKAKPARLGIVSQSGAYGAHVFLVAQSRGMGATSWVTTGNEIDIDVCEVIEYFAHSPEIDVILAYAEGIRDGAGLQRALDAARRARKPVVFLKSGRSSAGALAAASHTASLAGSDVIYDAALRQWGAYRARTTEEMVDIAYACLFGKFAGGRRLGIQSISGGVGIQMADACEDFQMEVPQLPIEAQRKMKELVPFASAQNPIDFTAQVLQNPDVMKSAVGLTLESDSYDAQVIYLSSIPGAEATRATTLDIFTGIRERYPKELIVLTFISPPEIVREYERLGYPCFEDPSHAVRALAALSFFGALYARKSEASVTMAFPSCPSIPDHPMNELEAKAILAAAGIPVSRETLARSPEEAIKAWASIGAPVVLKIASSDIPHKTEIGGVILDLNSAADVRNGYMSLLHRATSARPDAVVDGVVVAEMVHGGVEAVLGVSVDPVFGAAVMFGLGGIFVEVLKDVTFRVAPFDVDEARLMVSEIRGRAVLSGVRGAPACDVDALAECISRLSIFAACNATLLNSIDINPLILQERGVIAVDALIVPVRLDFSAAISEGVAQK